MQKSLAHELDQKAIKWGFKTYWNKDFLKLADIDALNQTEQDRIFNELVLAPEILIMVAFQVWNKENIGDQIAKEHTNFMKEIGVEKQYRKLWEKLINIRYQEYHQSKNNARVAMIEFDSQEKDVLASDIEDINTTLPPFAISVLCHKHILRGKTRGKDLLFKLIFKNLGRFYTDILVTIGGEKIKTTTKMKIKLRHLANDIKEKFTKN